MKSNQIIVIAAACVITVALRFVQLPITNFGSMLALSLMCGFAIRRPWACIVPLAIRLLTDIGLQMQTGYGFFPNWYFDYAAYILVALLGQQISNGKLLKNASHVIAGVALVSLIGFGGAWLVNSSLTVEQLKIVRPVAQFSAAILLGYVTVMAIGHDQLKRVFAATAGSIAIYFLISNFGSWVYAPQAYERSLAGLANCYVMGIPFVRATVLGNLLLAPVFFGAWNLATRTAIVPENVAVE